MPADRAGHAGPIPRIADSLSSREPAQSSRPRWRTPHHSTASPEIDCLRRILPQDIVTAAEQRAAGIATGADMVLINAGVVTEKAYAGALAQWLGIRFDDLSQAEDAAKDHDQLIAQARTGILKFGTRPDSRLIVAPQGLNMRRLIALLAAHPELAPNVAVTTRARLDAFVRSHAGSAIGEHAAFGLRSEHRHLSAGARGLWIIPLVLLAALSAVSFLAPSLVWLAVNIVLALIFLGSTALRFLGALGAGARIHRQHALDERHLPVYTVIVALYREAATLPGLVGALSAIDYPVEKLDIKFVIEPDDDETREALSRQTLPTRFEVVVAPDIGPRTKPKALNVALPLARGDFVVIYDAEDRPEPDQIRRALQAFSSSDPRLACVQARLTVDNTTDSWLTRIFTAEYAGLFDVFLPGVAAWRLPLPLGGTSNHFRADILRRVGAWDPFNVTEDADLGMRLARFGYRTDVIDSTTFEEAPIRFRPWLCQRTRWIKGWMQTWLVHMRNPVTLWDNLGAGGFLIFQLVVGGGVMTALVHLLFVFLLALDVLAQLADPEAIEASESLLTALHGTTLIAGYLISGLIGVIGLARRKLLNCAWALAFMPFYWILLSIAACRALVQLIRDPYRWEKTQHGLARHSRLANAHKVSR